MVSQRVPKCPSLSRRVPADSQCFPAYFWVSHSHFGRKRGKMSPSQRRPNASQPILACPKTCSSRLSSVPRPSRQSEGVRRLAIDQLSDRWRAPPSRFPNRRVPNRSTTRQGLSHEPSQATKKNVKKKNLFFFKQTTIVRSCGLPNYETKLIFFVLLFFCFKPGAT